MLLSFSFLLQKKEILANANVFLANAPNLHPLKTPENQGYK